MKNILFTLLLISGLSYGQNIERRIDSIVRNAIMEQGISMKDFTRILDSIIEIKLSGVITEIPKVIYQGKNAAGPDDLDSVDDIVPGDFDVRSVKVADGYALEFKVKPSSSIDGAAIAEIPMIGTVPGEVYDIRLTFRRTGSQRIDVRATEENWEEQQIIKDEGAIEFKNVSPRFADAPIYVQSYANRTGDEGARIDDIVIKKND